MSGNEPQTDKGSFFFFERSESDLPYYRDPPVGLSLTSWLIVLAAVALSYVVLLNVQQMFHSGFSGFIPPVLFVLIPLVALAAVAGPRAPLALFKPLGLKDFGLIVAFFILNAVVTVVSGLVMTGFFHTSANPAGDMVASASGMDQILFFGWTAVQLLGEEIFTILIFLGALALLNRVLSRKVAMCIAALIAAIIFGMIHLPTYQGNIVQAVGLVPIRIVLLMPFIITRNIWASTGTHILNDYAIFGMSVIGGMEAA